MHAILVSVGTDGDVFPFVSLGIRLRARGHRVTLVANEHYQASAVQQGFAFRGLVTNQETNELIGNPDIWHPFKSAIVGARWGRRALQRQCTLLTELSRDEDAVLVAYPPVFAARLVQEQLLRPLASLVVMPWLILSKERAPGNGERIPSAARGSWVGRQTARALAGSSSESAHWASCKPHRPIARLEAHPQHLPMVVFAAACHRPVSRVVRAPAT